MFWKSRGFGVLRRIRRTIISWALGLNAGVSNPRPGSIRGQCHMSRACIAVRINVFNMFLSKFSAMLVIKCREKTSRSFASELLTFIRATALLRQYERC